MSLIVTTPIPFTGLSITLILLVIFRFVITHYNDVEPYFAMDPLLRTVFVALTPEDEFPLLCQWMPPFLTASRLTHMLKKEATDKKVVYIFILIYILLYVP